MAQGFNIVARLQLQGPTNVSQVVQQIQKQLSNVNVKINAQLSPQAQKAAQQTSRSLNNLNQSATKANTSITQLSTSSSKAGSSASSAAKNFNQATTAATAFGKASSLAVKRFAAFTVGAGIIGSVVVALKNGVKEAVAFEKEIIKVSQVTGQSVNSLGSLQKEITGLSTSLGVASSELVTVARTLSQTGISAREVKAALKALAQSALAPTFKDMSNTVEGAISIMRQFGVQADDIGKKLGSINALAGSFAVEAQDLVFAVRRAGGAFKAAGGNLEELLALFTSVRATTRESAETIATGFRTIFTRIQRPKTIAFLKEAGVELQNMAGQFVGPYEAVNRLSKALRELESTDPRFQQIIEELGGFRQVSKVIPLIQQFGTAQKALGVALRGQDSLARDSVKAQQSLAVQLTKVREQFLGLMRDVAGGDTFKTMASTAVGLASSFLKVADALKPILPLMAGLVAFQGLRFGAQFTTGFLGGLRGAGGASGAGRGVSGTITGSNSSTAATKQSQALASNTTALLKLNSSISNLQTAINRNIAATNKSAVRGAGSLGGRRGRRPRGFNTGGLVPGQGHGDTVPAMLEPGEFVVRKSSVEKYGASNIARMNVGGKLGDVSRKRRLRGGPRGAFYASGRSNRFAKRMHGGKKKRAYVFDFDDTLAVSDARVREGEEDPFSDFRGAKGGQFIRSARATRYASMARRRASRGHDIHVLTARPGDKTTRSSIHHFMRGVGAPAKSVVGTGGFSAKMGGTAAAKRSVVRSKIAPHYEKTIFLDDDHENVMAVGALKNVKSVHVGKSGLSRHRLNKQFGGQVQKFLVGGVSSLRRRNYGGRRDTTSGAGLVAGTASLMRTRQASTTPGSKVTREFDSGKRTSNAEVLGAKAAANAHKKARGLADPDWYGGAFLRPGNRNVLYKGVNDKEEIRNLIKKTPGFVKFQNIKNSIDKGAKGSKAKFVRELEKGEKKIIGTYSSRNKYHIETGSLSKVKSTEMEERLLKGVHDTVKSGAKVLSKTLKTKFDNSSVSKAMKQANIDQTLGNLFGQILMYAGGRWSPKDADAANSPWDFPKGLRGVSKDFAIKKTHVKTDAKTSFTNSNIKSLMHKVDTQNAVEAQTELDSVFSELASSPALKGKSFVRGVGEDLGVNKRRRRRGMRGGGGIPKSDTVPALLTPGEFVVNKKSAQSIGYGALNSLNKGTKRVQGYAKGGLVQHFKSGGKSEGGGMSGGGMLTLLFAIDMLAASFTQGNKELAKWVGILSATGTALIGVKAVLNSVASSEGLAALGGSLQQSGIAQIKGGASSGKTRINVSGMNKAFGRAKLGVGKFTSAVGGMMGPLSAVAAGLTAAYVAAGILASNFKQAGLEMLEHARTSTQEEAALDKWVTGERIDNAKKIGGMFALVAGGIATVIGGILAATGVLSPIGAALMAGGVAVASAGAGAAFGYGQNPNTQPFMQAKTARDSQRQRGVTGGLLKRVNSSGLGLSGSTGQQAISSIRKEFNLLLTQTDPDKKSEQDVELKRRLPELQNMVTMILESGQDFATAAGGLGPAVLELISDITGIPLEKLEKETKERETLIRKINEAKDAKAAESAETRNVTRELGIFNTALQAVNDGLGDLETTLNGIAQMGLFGDVYAPFGSAAGREGIIGRAAEGGRVNSGDFSTAVGQVTSDPFLQEKANDIVSLQNILPDVISKAALKAQTPGGPTFGSALRDILAEEMGLDSISGNALLEGVVQSLTAVVTKTTTEQGGPNATLGKMMDDPMSYVQDALNEGDAAFLNALQESFAQMVQAQEKINGLMQQRMSLEKELLQRQQKIRKAEKQLEDFDRSQERGGLGRPMTLAEINERQKRDTNSILGGTRGAGMGGDVAGLTGALMQINRDREDLLERQREDPDLDISTGLGDLNNEALRVTTALEGLGDQAEKLASLQKLLAKEQKKRQFKEDQLLRLAFGDEDDAQSFVNSIHGSQLVQQGLNPQMLPPQARQDTFNFLTQLGDTPMEFLGGQSGTDVLRTGLVSYLQGIFPEKSEEQIGDMVDPIINATMEEKRIQRAIRQTLIDQIFVQKMMAAITQDAIRRNTDVLEAAIERAEKGITAAIYRAEADRAERKARKAQSDSNVIDNQIEAREDLNTNNVFVDEDGDGEYTVGEKHAGDVLDRPLTFDETTALPGASGAINSLGTSGGNQSDFIARGEDDPETVGVNEANVGTTIGDISQATITTDPITGDSSVSRKKPDKMIRPKVGTEETTRRTGRYDPFTGEYTNTGTVTVPGTDPTYDNMQSFDDGTGTGDLIQFGDYLDKQLDGVTDSDERTEIIKKSVEKFYGEGGLAGTNLSGQQVNALTGKVIDKHQSMNADGTLDNPGGAGVGGEIAVQDFMGTVLEQHATAANAFNTEVDRISTETGIAADVIRQFAQNLDMLNAFLQTINDAGTTPIAGPGGLQAQSDDAFIDSLDADDAASTAGGRADRADTERGDADTRVDDAMTSDGTDLTLKKFKLLVERYISLAATPGVVPSEEQKTTLRTAAVNKYWTPQIADELAGIEDKDSLSNTPLSGWSFNKGGLADFNAGRIRSGADAGSLSQGKDDILGLVHHGEYMVPADKVDGNLPILDAITNGNGLSKMPIPKFANGGLVGMLPTIAKSIAAAGGGIGFGETSSSINLGKVSDEITGGKKLKQLYDELQKINTSIQQLPGSIGAAAAGDGTRPPGTPSVDVPDAPFVGTDGGGGPVRVEIVGSTIQAGPSYAAVGGAVGGAGAGAGGEGGSSSSSPSGPGPVTAGTGSAAGSLSRSSDTRLAVLTPGEFVINRDATAQHRGLLEAINSGVYAKTGGEIGYYRGGTKKRKPLPRPGPLPANATNEEKQEHKKNLQKWVDSRTSTRNQPMADFNSLDPEAGGLMEGRRERDGNVSWDGFNNVPQGTVGGGRKKQKKSTLQLDYENGAPGLGLKNGKVIKTDRTEYDKWRAWDTKQAKLIKKYKGTPKGRTGIHDKNNPVTDSPEAVANAVVGSSFDYDRLGSRAHTELNKYNLAQKNRRGENDGEYGRLYDRRQAEREIREEGQAAVADDPNTPEDETVVGMPGWKDYHVLDDPARPKDYNNIHQYRASRDADLYHHMNKRRKEGYHGDSFDAHNPDRFLRGGHVGGSEGGGGGGWGDDLSEEEKRRKNELGINQLTEDEFNEKASVEIKEYTNAVEGEQLAAITNWRQSYLKDEKQRADDQAHIDKMRGLGIGTRKKSLAELEKEVGKEHDYVAGSWLGLVPPSGTDASADDKAEFARNRFEQQYSGQTLTPEDAKALGIREPGKAIVRGRFESKPQVEQTSWMPLDNLVKGTGTKNAIPYDQESRDELIANANKNLPDSEKITEKDLQGLEDAEYRQYALGTKYPEKLSVNPAKLSEQREVAETAVSGEQNTANALIHYQRYQSEDAEDAFGDGKRYTDASITAKDFNDKLYSSALDAEYGTIEQEAGTSKDKDQEQGWAAYLAGLPKNDAERIQKEITAEGEAEFGAKASQIAMAAALVPGGQLVATAGMVTADAADLKSAAHYGQAYGSLKIKSKTLQAERDKAEKAGVSPEELQKMNRRIEAYDLKATEAGSNALWQLGYATAIPAAIQVARRGVQSARGTMRGAKPSRPGLPPSRNPRSRKTNLDRATLFGTDVFTGVKQELKTAAVVGGAVVGERADNAIFGKDEEELQRKAFGGLVGYFGGRNPLKSGTRKPQIDLENINRKVRNEQINQDFMVRGMDSLEQKPTTLGAGKAKRGAKLLEERTKRRELKPSDSGYVESGMMVDDFDYSGINVKEVQSVREHYIRRIKELEGKAKKLRGEEMMDAQVKIHKTYEDMSQFKAGLIRHDPNLAIKSGERPMSVTAVLEQDIKPKDFVVPRTQRLSSKQIETQLERQAAAEADAATKGQSLKQPDEFSQSSPIFVDDQTLTDGPWAGFASEAKAPDLKHKRGGRDRGVSGKVRVAKPEGMSLHQEFREFQKTGDTRSFIEKIKGKKLPKNYKLTANDLNDIREYQELIRHEVAHRKTAMSTPDAGKSPTNMDTRDAAITIERAREGDRTVTAKDLVAAEKTLADRAAYIRKARTPGYVPTPAPDTLGSRVVELQSGADVLAKKRKRMELNIPDDIGNDSKSLKAYLDSAQDKPKSISVSSSKQDELLSREMGLRSQSDILNEIQSNMSESTRRGVSRKTGRQGQDPSKINVGKQPPSLPGADLPRVANPEDMSQVRENAGAGFLFDDHSQRQYAAYYAQRHRPSNTKMFNDKNLETLQSVPVNQWATNENTKILWQNLGEDGQAYALEYQKNVKKMRMEYLEAKGTPEGLSKAGHVFVRKTDPNTGKPTIVHATPESPLALGPNFRPKDDPNFKVYKKGGLVSYLNGGGPFGVIKKLFGFDPTGTQKAVKKANTRIKQGGTTSQGGLNLNEVADRAMSKNKSAAQLKREKYIATSKTGGQDMEGVAGSGKGFKNFEKGKQPWDINPETGKTYAEELMPELEEGMKRVYRTVDDSTIGKEGRRSGRAVADDGLEGSEQAAGKWFSDDVNQMSFYANQLINEGGTPRLTYLDMPIDEASQYRVSTMPPKELPEGFPADPWGDGSSGAMLSLMKSENLTADHARQTLVSRYLKAQENLPDNPKFHSGGPSSHQGLPTEYYLKNLERVDVPADPYGRPRARYTDDSKYLKDVKAFNRGGLVGYFGGSKRLVPKKLDPDARAAADLKLKNLHNQSRKKPGMPLEEIADNATESKPRLIDRLEELKIDGEGTKAAIDAKGANKGDLYKRQKELDNLIYDDASPEKIAAKRLEVNNLQRLDAEHVKATAANRAENSYKLAEVRGTSAPKSTPETPTPLPIVKKPHVITEMTDIYTGEGINIRQGPDPMDTLSKQPLFPGNHYPGEDFQLTPAPEIPSGDLDLDSQFLPPHMQPQPYPAGPYHIPPRPDRTSEVFTDSKVPWDEPPLNFSIDDQLKHAARGGRPSETIHLLGGDVDPSSAAIKKAQKSLGNKFFAGKNAQELQHDLLNLRQSAGADNPEMLQAVEDGEAALTALGIKPLRQPNVARLDHDAIRKLNEGYPSDSEVLEGFTEGGAGPEVADRVANATNQTGKSSLVGPDGQLRSMQLNNVELTPKQLQKLEDAKRKRRLDRKRSGGMISYLQFGGDLKDNRIMPLPDVTPGQGHLNISSPNLNDNPAKQIQEMMEVIYGRSRIGTDNKTGKAKAFPGGRRKREMGKESWMSDRKGNLAKKGKGMDPNIAEELFPSFYAKQPWLDTKSEEEDHLFFLGQEEFGSEEERNAFLGSRNFPEMFTGGHLRYNRGMGSGEGAYSPSRDRVQLPQRDVAEMGLFQSLNRRTLDISPLGQATLHEGQQHRATNEMLLQEGRKMMGLPSGSEYPRAFETGDSRQPRITGAHTLKGELTTGLTFPSGERTDFDKMLKEMSPDVFKATKAYQRNTGIQSTWEEDRGKPGTGERKDFWEIFGKDKGTNFQKYATGGDELMARVRTIADWNAMNDPNVLEALGKLEKGASNEEILDIYRNTQRMNSSLGLDEEGSPDIGQSWKNIQKYRKAMDKNYPEGAGPRGLRNMGMQRQTLEAMLGDEEQKKHLSELLILARKSGGPITRLEEGGGTGTGVGSPGAPTSTGGPVSHGTGVPAGDLTRSTDTRLTALTPGEFVVNKSMTDRHRGLLEQINSGQYARDGGIIYRSLGTPTLSGVAQPTPQFNQPILSQRDDGPQGQPVDFSKLTQGADTIKDAFNSFTSILVGLDFAGQIREAMSGNDIFKSFSDAIKGESALTKSLNDFTEKFGGGQTIKHEMTIPGIKDGMKLDPQEMERFKSDVITAVVSVLQGNQPESPVNKPAGDVT